MKMTWNIGLFTFGNFTKGDGFRILLIISIK